MKNSVDLVVTSPPYGDSQLGSEEKRSEKAARLIRVGLNPGDLLGGKAGNLLLKHYSKSRTNIGNLPMRTNGQATSCNCKIDGELDFSSTAGFGRFKQYFSEDSVTHPAKANLNLLWFLVSKYSKPGETILDPMAGTFSTGIIAALQGRNGVGVELEEHFLKMARESIRRTKKDAKGTMTLLKGDSRRLSRLMHKRFGTTIFSPPYSNIASADNRGGVISPHMQGLISKLSGIPVADFAHNYRRLQDAMRIAREKVPFRYSSSLKNIGNLEHGDIDQIISSPPYSTANRGGGIAVKGYEGRFGGDARMKDRIEHTLSENPSNLSNLRHGSVGHVIMSPPYADMRGKERHGYSALDERMQIEKGLLSATNYPSAKGQIGSMNSQTYLGAMYKVYAESFGVLKPGGRMILILKDFIKKGKVVLLHEDTMKLCNALGFRLETHLLSKLPAQSFWRILYHKKHPNAPVLTHEHILVYRRPAWK
jgi:DNA modification methylase